jgi:hypothetical protein
MMAGMGDLPIKYRDGFWHVLVGDGHWVKVESDSDAYQLAASADLARVALEGDREGDEIARELESCAALFAKYGILGEAKYMTECAKFARQEPSVFDGIILD